LTVSGVILEASDYPFLDLGSIAGLVVPGLNLFGARSFSPPKEFAAVGDIFTAVADMEDVMGT
jgi:hypothetical protein